MRIDDVPRSLPFDTPKGALALVVTRATAPVVPGPRHGRRLVLTAALCALCYLLGWLGRG